MDIAYLANARIPTEKAHGIQIMKMCEAFTVQGNAVTLVVPQRWHAAQTDPFTAYGVMSRFPIVRLPCLDLLILPFAKWTAFWLQYVTFAMSAYVWLMRHRPPVVYTRDALLTLVASMISPATYYEIHTVPHNGLFIHRIAWRRAKKIIAISNGVKNALIALGVTPEKVHVAPDSVDAEMFKPKDKQEARRVLGLPQEAQIVVYTGHLYPWKGAHLLLRAATLLPKEVQVYLVGGTREDVSRLKNAYPETGAALTGYRPYAEIPLWLSAADLLVLPTSAKELIGARYTSPLKLFEYMASGTPLLASDTPSHREILDDATAAFFAADDPDALAQGIERALADRTHADARAAQAKEKARAFSWEVRAATIRHLLPASAAPTYWQRFIAWALTHRTEIYLALFSFALNLVVSVALYARFGEEVLYVNNEDARGYVALAETLLRSEGFSINGIPSAFRTPLYPLILAALAAIPGPIAWPVLIFHNLAATLTVILIYRCGMLLFSRSAGLIAALIYALEPYIRYTVNLSTTETLFNLLLVAGTYAFARWFTGNASQKMLIAAATWYGLTILTRPVALYLPLALVILVAMQTLIRRERMVRAFFSLTLFLAVTAAIIAPWSIRQYRTFGSLRLTNVDAIMLYFRTATFITAEVEGIDEVTALERLKTRLKERFPDYTDERVYTTFRYYSYMTGEAMRLVREYPAIVVSQYAASLIPTLFGTSYDYLLTDLVGIPRAHPRVSYSKVLLTQGPRDLVSQFKEMTVHDLFLLGGIGAWTLAYLIIFAALCRRRAWRAHGWGILLVITLAGYFIFFGMGPSSHTRYRMPSFPFLFLLIGFACDWWWGLTRKRHHDTVEK